MTEELHLITFETEVYHQGLKIDLEVSSAQSQPVNMQGGQDKMLGGMGLFAKPVFSFHSLVSEKSLIATPGEESPEHMVRKSVFSDCLDLI